MRKHAILSASGAERWMACPPSAQLEETMPESTNEYAQEGSFAHALAELHLQSELKMITKRQHTLRLNKMKKSEWYCKAMEEYIENYSTIVMEQVSKANKQGCEPIVGLEQKLDFSFWVPEGFGTGDVIIIDDLGITIIDLKYGKGVPVSAESNPQLRLYGLGALNMFGMLYSIEAVRTMIIQPRLDHISEECLSAKELSEWGEEIVKPKAKLAIAGEGEFKAGPHCQFCRAKAVCRARAEANLAIAKYDFAEPPTLNDEEMADILARAGELQTWVKAVYDHALDQAVNHNKKWAGWKLVEGRSNRKYTDDRAVAKRLLDEGYKEEEVYQKKVYGITAITKLLGNKRFTTLLGGLVIKPPGKPTLVPESDKRPEMSSTASAVKDFS